MTDFLLELRSEEIPARMQDKARDDLARLFAAELEKAGLRADAIVTFATPRRLALIARDLPAETAAASDEIKGPRVGAPPQALEGFLRKTGLTTEQLTERDGVLYAVIDKPGRATRDVLAEAIPAIVRQFPWPKSMRWGAASLSTESLRWVRPLHGIVALFGEDVVDCEIAGVASGAVTLGHRFHHPGPITIGSAGDYEEKLRACHVIVDQDQRRAIIRYRASDLARGAGLELIADEGLVAENAGLTEWPVPLLGRFDAAFLDVPPEVIQLTARVNQKYFVCRIPPRNGEVAVRSADGGAGDAQPSPSTTDLRSAVPLPEQARGGLANAFVCVANIDAADGGAKIVEGNRKVLAARLADARFFYETDLKVPLAEQAKKLEKIVFHEKLGTVADKVERVAKLARWLVEEGIVGSTVIPAQAGIHSHDATGSSATSAILDSRLRGNDADRAKLAAHAERAAQLAKADLVTGMVGEFPELQGVMGGYYAAAQGEDPAVAAAIRDHYKPVGQGDDVPTDPVTVAVSLADKLDTLVGFFALGAMPTGSRDPYALRRAALGIVSLLFNSSIRVSLRNLVTELYVSLVTPRLTPDGQLLPYSASLIEDDTVSAWPFSENDPASLANDVIFTFHVVGSTRKLPVGSIYPATLRSFDETVSDLLDFFADRLKVQQREAGVRHDLVDAVFALGGEDDLVRLLARVRALQAFVGTEDGANLLAGYKRAANILKKEGVTDAPAQKHLSYTPEKAESDLIAALDAAQPAAADAVAREDFESAMAALATLRAPIDVFFDSVTVNDPDADKRSSRLALLARVRDAVHGVADFSKIEG